MQTEKLPFQSATLKNLRTIILVGRKKDAGTFQNSKIWLYGTQDYTYNIHKEGTLLIYASHVPDCLSILVFLISWSPILLPYNPVMKCALILFYKLVLSS